MNKIRIHFKDSFIASYSHEDALLLYIIVKYEEIIISLLSFVQRKYMHFNGMIKDWQVKEN
jgi:hypothetical protein